MERNLITQKNIENIMLSAIENKLSNLIERIYNIIEVQAKDGLNNTEIYWCDFEGYELYDWRRIKLYLEKQGFIVDQYGQKYTVIW